MKRVSIRIAAFALAALATASFAIREASAQTTSAAQPAPATGDATRGKASFLRYGCYECHGTVAQGNYVGVPHLAPHPIPQAALIAYVRKPTGTMPSYSAAILSEKDAADIWAYLASIPVGRTAAQIPTLNISTKPAK